MPRRLRRLADAALFRHYAAPCFYFRLMSFSPTLLTFSSIDAYFSMALRHADAY